MGSPNGSLVNISPPNSAASFSFVTNFLGANPENGYSNYRNQIAFIPVPGDDSTDGSNFDGAIDNVSLTGTYLISQGGEVENWVIEGVEEGTNEIVFNDGAITFNNAVGAFGPTSIETFIYQTLPVDVANDNFRIKKYSYQFY